VNAPAQRPVTDRIPPQLYIVGSGLIQYVGAALAVVAFASVEPASVAWWRVLTGAIVLLAWKRPWRGGLTRSDLAISALFGVIILTMNSSFYESIARIPLGTAVSIEFIGPVAVAVIRGRGWRPRIAAVLAFAGVACIGGLEELTDLQRSERLARMRDGELGSIHSWELVTAVDGPGTRMTVFLNGCPLRCQYCHNPDTFLMKDGEPVEAEELLRRMRRYRGVFRASKGGITLSGGEVLMQPAFAGRLLAGAKKMGIHTCIDTSGFLGANASDEMLDNIDLVLLDVKSGDEETYKKVTGRSLAPTITFGDRLAAKGIEIWARFVLVPDLTDDPENVHNVARIIERWGSVSRVEVLPFHQMGTDKWDALGLTYQLRDTRPPEPELVESTRAIFRSYGFEVH